MPPLSFCYSSASLPRAEDAAGSAPSLGDRETNTSTRLSVSQPFLISVFKEEYY